MSQVNEIKHFTRIFQSEIDSPKHYSNTRCTSCGKEMEFVEGDIIYGENWYHNDCWTKTQKGGKQNV